MDRHKGELWVGPRLGVPESQHKYGVDRCEDIGKLPDLLKTIKKNKKNFVVMPGVDAQVESFCRDNLRKILSWPVYSEMRLCKMPVKSRFSKACG